MVESIVQKASLIGQAVEDLTYTGLSRDRFAAELVGAGKPAEYKPGGFFVFSDLRPGEYVLRLAGRGFQTEQHTVTVPVAEPPRLPSEAPIEAPIFDQAGDNELFVIVKTANGSAPQIKFDELILTKEIRDGALVLGPEDFETVLTAGLDVGPMTQLKVASVAGLTPSSILRIIRDRSICLKFGPYHQLPFELTRLVGKVVLKSAPELPFEGAKVRLTQVNGDGVVVNDIAGAGIVTALIDGTQVILGNEKDITTTSNQRGDFNLYFGQAAFLAWLATAKSEPEQQVTLQVTLEVTLYGYQTESATVTINAGKRNRIDDIELVKA